MRNNQQNMTTLQKTNVVYRFQCTTGDRTTRNVYYVGLTTTSLSRRLTMHLQDGGPKTHLHDHHGMRLTRDLLTTNTTILARRYDKRRLSVAETIFIRDTAPIINTQTKTLTNIPLFDRQMTIRPQAWTRLRDIGIQVESMLWIMSCETSAKQWCQFMYCVIC